VEGGAEGTCSQVVVVGRLLKETLDMGGRDVSVGHTRELMALS
jgi:hypothetical protein